MTDHRIRIEREKCIGCGLCAGICVSHNIRLTDGKAGTIIQNCLMCGQCSAVCPQKAIVIEGFEEKPVEQAKTVRLNPDEVLQVIRFRRTIRSFQNKEIPPQVLQQILEAGRLTHTAKNMQDVSFVVLEKEKDSLERLAVALFRKLKPLADCLSPFARNSRIDDHFFFFQAPAVIVILAKDKANGILAAQNMEFVAEAYGLGVLFSGFFTACANVSGKIRRTLKIPKGKKAAATLVLGYPKIQFLRSAQRERLDVRYM